MTKESIIAKIEEALDRAEIGDTPAEAAYYMGQYFAWLDVLRTVDEDEAQHIEDEEIDLVSEILLFTTM